jgi:predicted small lipoprotein YifL
MHCWARYLFYAIVTLFAIGQILVACGQTGDLYLPEPSASKAAPKSTATEPRMLDTDPEGMQAIDDIPDATPGPVSPQAEGL